MADENGLEQRVAMLEVELARLKNSLNPSALRGTGVDQLPGILKDDPDFDEIVQLGAEYRESQTSATHG